MTSRLTAHRQRGVTAIGWIFLLVPIFVLGYLGMRSIPVYSNYMAVSRALNNFAKENENNGEMTREQLKDFLSRKWESEYITNPTIDELIIKRQDGGWMLAAEYEQVVPLFYNVSLLFQFDKSVSFR